MCYDPGRVDDPWEAVIRQLKQIRTPEDLLGLDRMLDDLACEGWGEVRLIVENGRLRWIKKISSMPFRRQVE